MCRGKWKHLVIVNFLSVILILNATSLSATNRMSTHLAFADDCYDSDGNYICTDMSDGSSGDSGSDSSDSTGGDSGGDSPNGNTGSDTSNGLTDVNTGNYGSSDTSGDSNTGDSSGGDTSGGIAGDSGNNCSDEEGGFVCATPMPDENPPGNQDSIDDDKSSNEGGNETDNNHAKQITSPDKCDNNSTCTDSGKLSADAGPDEEVSEGNSITIDGSQSNDPNGDNLQYNWNVKDPGLEVGNQESAELEVKAPEVQGDSYYIISLTVTDKDGNTDSDQMSLKVTNTNTNSDKPGINPEPVLCEGNMTSNDGCQQANPEPVLCDGNMTGDGCEQPSNPEPLACDQGTNHTNLDCPQPNLLPCEEGGNVTNLDCPQPKPAPLFCVENATATGPDCRPNSELQRCDTYGNMTNASGQICLTNPNPGFNTSLLNSTTASGPNMTKLIIDNTNLDILANFTLPNLNRTEIGFRNGTETLNVTLPIFNFSKIEFDNATLDVGNLTGFYYENGTSAALNNSVIPLTNGTLLSLNNTNLSPFQNIIAVADSIYSQSLSDIHTVKDITSTIQSIGNLAGGLQLLHTITCNDFIKFGCIPFPFADDIAKFVLDKINNNLSNFLKNYDFDRSITVFQDGKSQLVKLKNGNDTQGLALFGTKNGEAYYWMYSLSNDLWLKSSKGFAATIGDVVIFAGKVKGDNGWIQTGQKIKTIHDDLVQDSSSLFKLQKMIDSYLGQKPSPSPSPPHQPKKEIHFPPIIKSNNPPTFKTKESVTTTKRLGVSNYYYIGKIGLPGSAKGQLLEPTDTVIDTLHNLIYVADKSNNRIDVFDTSGKYIKSWGSLGSGKGQFNNPADLSADFARGIIFVSDIGNNRVQKFDTNGNFLGMWGSTGTDFGQFDHTGDISLDPSEKMVYVTDIANHRIQKFDYDGNFVKSWGALGTGKGQFNRPAGLTYDSSGSVFVADTKNNRIQKFDKEGNFIQSWGVQGKGLGQLQNPVSIASEPDSDYLYVTHGGDKRIEVFDKQGKYVTSWGSVGVGNGQLIRPVSVAFGNDNKIFVADKDKSEIDIFGIIYQTQPNEVKKTTTTTTTKTSNGNEKNNKDSNDSTDKGKKHIKRPSHRCDPSYPDFCIRSPPPDLDCPDISHKNFKVIGSDPHGFDIDGDGKGCESSSSTGAVAEPPAQSEKGKIQVTYGDVSGYNGKANIQIKNLDKGQTLVSAKLNFGKQHASQGEHCCIKTYDFDWKGSRVGDQVGIKVSGGGGSWEDNSGYQLKKGTTKVSITLDEIGE